jgi:RimJ/RimL family protein N-acetyltransferase
MSVGGLFPAQTPRLRLRVLRASDEAFYCSLYADPDTMRHIGPPLDEARAVRCFRAARAALRRTPARLITFVITGKETWAPVGIGSLAFGAAEHRDVEAGIILHGAARARGYAREALAALVERVFAACPVDRIRALHSVDHSVAGRTIGSVGFERVGTTGESRGQAVMQVWTLDRTCWESNKNRTQIP